MMMMHETKSMLDWSLDAHVNLCRLDGEHVVFGKVIQGMDIVYAIEGGAGTYSGKPRKKVIIADSGEIPKDKWDEERWSSFNTSKFLYSWIC